MKVNSNMKSDVPNFKDLISISKIRMVFRARAKFLLSDEIYTQNSSSFQKAKYAVLRKTDIYSYMHINICIL